jgi:hypothetical protein
VASKTAKKNDGPEMMRRISARDICGDVAKLVKDAGQPIDLFHIYGLADGTKTKTTSYGDAVAITGMIEVVRCEDGEVLMGAVAYLPEPAGSSIAERVKAIKVQGENVQFAMTIGVKPDAKSSKGYVYTMKPFLKPEQRSQLDALRSEVKGLIA